jgi:hypothetical protein
LNKYLTGGTLKANMVFCELIKDPAAVPAAGSLPDDRKEVSSEKIEVRSEK